MSTLEKKLVPTSLLVSATYNSQKNAAVLKFYDPKSQKIILWPDQTGHKPYCFSKLNPEELDFLSDRDDVEKIETVKKYDLLEEAGVTVQTLDKTKIKYWAKKLIADYNVKMIPK